MVQSVQIGLLGLSEATCRAPLRGPSEFSDSLRTRVLGSSHVRHYATFAKIRSKSSSFGGCGTLRGGSTMHSLRKMEKKEEGGERDGEDRDWRAVPRGAG